MITIRAITILQPWASLIACGKKQIETRSWATKYRGPIAIHAGKGKQYIDLCRQQIFWSNLWTYEISAAYTLQERIESIPLGAVIAIAELIACEEMTMDKIVLWRDVYGKEQIAFGDFQPGRYAWILENVRPINPVPAKGRQRLWEWDSQILS